METNEIAHRKRESTKLKVWFFKKVEKLARKRERSFRNAKGSIIIDPIAILKGEYCKQFVLNK